MRAVAGFRHKWVGVYSGVCSRFEGFRVQDAQGV